MAELRRFLHVFSTFATGGPQVRFAQLANHAARRGEPVEHLICAMDGCHDARAKLDPAVRHRIIDPPDSAGLLPGTVLAFRRALKEHAPDLLLTYNWGSIEWSMANLLLGLPEVHFEDGFGPEEAAGQMKRRILTRRLVLRFRAFTVLPSNVLLDHAETLWRLPPARVAYIPNGIDCRRFDAVERDSSTQNTASDSVTIGTIAALRAEKNIGRLLQAFALLPADRKASLVIVGDGPERTALEAEAAALGIADRVRFTGHSAKPETALTGFDIFALSSDTEQMPISLVEAMASSLPVAAVDVGDVADMVAEENRDLIVPKEAAALARALEELAGDMERRRHLGRANRERALSMFDEELMAQRYRELFDKALRGRGQGGQPLLTGDALGR